jgi:hypothetical protein
MGESDMEEYHLTMKSLEMRERRSWIAEARKSGASGNSEGRFKVEEDSHDAFVWVIDHAAGEVKYSGGILLRSDPPPPPPPSLFPRLPLVPPLSPFVEKPFSFLHVSHKLTPSTDITVANARRGTMKR